MDLIEYLLFIPLLIFGIVLTDLLGEWSRFFDRRHWHAPYLITIVVFTEVAVWNIFGFLDVISRQEDHTYLSYVAVLSAPFTLLLSVNALLAGERRGGVVDPIEFAARMRLSYFFMGCFIALHFLPLFRLHEGFDIPRFVSAAIMFGVAATAHDRAVYVMGVFWIATLGIRFWMV